MFRGAAVKVTTLVSIPFLTLALTAAPAVTVRQERPVHRKNARLREYRKSMGSRSALLGSAVSAGYGQLRNRPHEWGGGVGGFAKRFGSSVAGHAVKSTIQFGVGGLLHENQQYVRSNRPGFGPHFKSALENTFWVRHTNSNKRYIAAGRLSGDFGSGLVSRLWQPARLHTVSSGLATGGIAVGADFGMNLAREYMPRHHHVYAHRVHHHSRR